MRKFGSNRNFRPFGRGQATSPWQGDSFYRYSVLAKSFHQIAPKHPGNGQFFIDLIINFGWRQIQYSTLHQCWSRLGNETLDKYCQLTTNRSNQPTFDIYFAAKKFGYYHGSGKNCVRTRKSMALDFKLNNFVPFFITLAFLELLEKVARSRVDSTSSVINISRNTCANVVQNKQLISRQPLAWSIRGVWWLYVRGIWK